MCDRACVCVRGCGRAGEALELACAVTVRSPDQSPGPFVCHLTLLRVRSPHARGNAVTREAPSCPVRGTARAEQRTRAAAKKRGEGTGSDGSPGHRPLHRRARRCVRDLPGPCLTPAVARRPGEGEAGAGRGDFRVSFQACGPSGQGHNQPPSARALSPRSHCFRGQTLHSASGKGNRKVIPVCSFNIL